MVYISYDRKDEPVVRKICQSLTMMGTKMFMSQDQVVGGDYAQELTKQIETAEAVLFFYSENAENSTWVKREVEYALSQKKRVIPVLLTVVADSGWYRYHLGKTQYVALGNDEPDTCANKIEIVLHNEGTKGDGKNHSPSAKRTGKATISFKGRPRECTHTAKANCESPSKSSRRRRLVVGIIIAVITVIVGLFIIWTRMTCLPEKSYPSPKDYANGNVHKSPPKDTAEIIEEEMIEEVEDNKITEENICNDDKISESIGVGGVPRLDTDYSEMEEWDYYDTSEYNSSTPNIWIYILVAFSIGCGLIYVLLRKKKSKKENVKLSSNIASKVSIDGNVKKEILPREIYSTHLDKGEYLIDFEDKSNNMRHQTYNHVVSSNECKVVFANFPDEEMARGKTIKCFIAGSKTLQSERDALRAVTCVMYNKWASKNFRILSYTFEDFERTAVLGGHQKQYNDFITEEADWALFIIDGRIGGITVEEYRKAMDAYKQNGKPKILALAKTGSEDNEEVAAIKSEINKEHQYWTDYSDISSMKLIFESTLNWDLIGLFQK